MMIKQLFKLCWLPFVIAQFGQMAFSHCQSLPLTAKNTLFSVTYSIYMYVLYAVCAHATQLVEPS